MANGGLEYLPAFAISLAIGLLIGLERERTPTAKAGLRTFTLVALFGTLAALLSEQTGAAWVLAGGLLVVGGMMVAAYARVPDAGGDPGTTTVAAIVLCYGLGAMVWYGYHQLAVMLAIVTTVLLYFKTELHGITKSLTRRDLISFLQFAVLSLVILPLLPNQNYGPYQALNPYQIWWMVVLISGVSLAGYAALRIAGQRHGAPLMGLFGGLVSSTATTLVFSRHARGNGELVPIAAVVILLANLMVLVRLGVIAAVVSPRLLPALLPVLGGGLLAGLAGTALFWRGLRSDAVLPALELNNPTEIRTALGFGLLYAAVLFAAAWLANYAGNHGLYAVALASGLADVDPITLSSLRLFELGRLAESQVVTAITLAFVANLAFKFGLMLFIGGAALSRKIAVGMLSIAVGVGAGWAAFHI